MMDRVLSTTCRVGMFAAGAVVLFGLAYGIVLMMGLLSLHEPYQPIGDPWFSTLEWLIVGMMPAQVTLMAAVHVWAPERVKSLSLSSLIFMSITAGLTVSLHFTILTVGGGEPALSFRWPSLAYALDILAWDLFFPLSILFAAPVFGGSRLQNAIRLLMTASGLLALTGLSAVLAGDMRMRNIGILGYAGIFPFAAALLAVFFRREHRTR